MKFNALENIQRKADGIESNSLSKKEQEKSSRQILNIEIEGKNYEVIKTHFTYPENIQKENGGVEGYDRFQLSWNDFDKEKFDLVNKEIKEYEEWDDHKKSLYEDKEKFQSGIKSKLDKISERLGVGTEMQIETISHYVNGAQYQNSNLEWNNNRFFLNKPYEISNLIDSTKKQNRQVMNGGGDTIYCLIKKEKSSESDKEHINEKIDIVRSAEGAHIFLVEDISKYVLNSKETNSVKNIKSFFKDEDLVIVPGMSFVQGSNLRMSGATGLNINVYGKTFFNFNDKNKAYKNYKENTKKYLEKNKNQLGPWKEIVNSSFASGNINGTDHPRGLLVFTKEFPAFNWAMADTAYVPMKDGPNFFKFYSLENKNEDIANETKE